MRGLIILITMVSSLLLAGCGEEEADQLHRSAVNDSQTEINLKLAAAAEDAGDLPSAEKLFTQASLNNNTSVTKIALANFYRRHNAADRAITILQDVNKAEPKNTTVTRALANAYVDAHNFDAALELLNKAIATSPNDAMLYNTKAVTLDMQGKHTEARTLYAKSLVMDPSNAMTYNANLGMSYILTEFYSKAIALLEPLAQQKNSTPEIRQNLAMAYGLKGDKENALKYAKMDVSDQKALENIKFYEFVAQKKGGGAQKPITLPVIPSLPPIPSPESAPKTSLHP